MANVFLRVLNMSLSASLVIAVVLAVRLCLRRAPKKWSYLLWSVVGFRLCCPVSFRAAFSVLRLAPELAAESVTPQTVYAPIFSAPAAPAAPVPAAPVTPVPALLPGVSGSVPLPAAAPDVVSSVDPIQVWAALGSLLWCVGIAAMLVCAVVSYVRLRRSLTGAVRTEENVWETDRVRSPFILGFFHPQIYLPLHLEGEMRGFALAHERYHLGRRDYLVKPFAWLLLTVHWFNPLVWLAFFLMTRDMEMRCDEAVLGRGDGSPKRYSYSLLSFASEKRFPGPSPLAFGETDVKRRIQNVLNWKKPRTWVTVAAVAVCVVVVAACAANPAENSQDLSFLNYKNAVGLIGQNGTQAAIYHELSGGKAITGKADDAGLIRFLEQASWKRRRAPAKLPDAAGSVEFVIEEEYRITLWPSPRLACVRFGEDERCYRTGKGDWESARALVRSREMSLSGGDSEAPAAAAVSSDWSEELMDALAQSWKEWNEFSSRLPGNIYREFETWGEACAFLGMTPWNPLEGSPLAEKKNWAGTDVVLPGSDTIKHAYVSASGPENGGVSLATLTAGYEVAGARVMLTALTLGEFGEHADTASPETYPLSDGSTAYCVRRSGEKYNAAELYIPRLSDAYQYKVEVIAQDVATLETALDRTLTILGLPVSADALREFQQSDPEGFTKQMQAWGAEVDIRSESFVSTAGEAGDWQDVRDAFAQAWLQKYLDASADSPYACSGGDILSLGNYTNGVSLTSHPRRLAFDVELALAPLDGEAFAFARIGWATKDELGRYHIQTEAVLVSDDDVHWRVESLNSGGTGGWGYRTLDRTGIDAELAYALSDQDAYGIHLLRFLPNLDLASLTSEQFNTVSERLHSAALATEALGGGWTREEEQRIRDLYMLWGLKNADGAYAELFLDGPECLLATQYRADPETFRQALGEMDDSTRAAVLAAMQGWETGIKAIQ